MVDFKTFKQGYPNLQDCSIQWFDDLKTRKDESLAWHHSMEWIDWSKIKKLNDDWCWIFFSVNSMIKWQRNKNSVTHINSRVAESDTLSKEDQMMLIHWAPLKPSMIIESKNSYHIYYFAQDATTDSWLEIERWLSTYYQWDKSFWSNYALVLRLPGAMHKKNPLDEFKTQCLYIEQTFFTEEQMKSSFPYDMSLEIKNDFVDQPLSLKESENIRDFMASLGNEYLLSRLSWSSLVKWEKLDFRRNNSHSKQIFCNGKSTACWIDEKDYIGSASDWWPTWIQRCIWYGSSKPDILKWFFEFCADLIPERFDRTSKQVALDKAVDESKREQKQIETKSAFQHITASEKIRRWFDELMGTDPKKVMKFWREERDSYLWWIYGWMIYLVWWDSWTWKSTYVNQIASQLAKTWVRVTRYSLEDRMEDSAKQEIYYTINRIRFQEKRPRLEWVPFVNWEYTHVPIIKHDNDILMDLHRAMEVLENSEIIDLDKTRDVKIDELVQLMNEECDKGTKCFFIDHLHYFKYETDKQREDLQIEAAMKGINEVARQRNVAVFLVAHYNSAGANTKDWKSSMSSFKWSSAIKQIANIIIQIRRDWDEQDPRTYFDVTKLRWPLPKKEIASRFDLATFQYEFTITEEQNRAEKKHLESKLFRVD